MGKKDIVWSKEAKEAFQKLKWCLQRLPTLESPNEGEVLTIYLSAS